MSVAEAMLCGTPVIAFNKGAMPELIQHGQTGFLVNNVAGAVDALLQIDSIQRADCRDWAASKFSSDKMVNDYYRLYQQILV